MCTVLSGDKIMMHWFLPWGWGYEQGLFHWRGIMGLLFLAAVGLIVYLVVRGETKRKHTGDGDAATPLEIVKKRYARGEISREEYEQLKKDLS
jgi:putative membrane protein